MADHSPRTPAQKLLEAARSTEIWLDRQFCDPNLRPHIAALVKSLRRYVRHCHRIVNRGDLSAKEADRRVRRILQSAYELMRADRL